MKHFIPAFRMYLVMTVLTGAAYPILVTLLGQTFFHTQANGSLVLTVDGNSILGSGLVAQNFQSEKYFWPRPSGGASYNPLPSGGTSLGPLSADLKKTFVERRSKLMAAHPDQGEPPQDLLFSSGSGLDPEISPEGAHYQIVRVAKARSMNVIKVTELVDKFTSHRQLGLLGEPRVHVLALNVALDQAQAGEPQ